jgi:hypothetical protein
LKRHAGRGEVAESPTFDAVVFGRRTRPFIAVQMIHPFFDITRCYSQPDSTSWRAVQVKRRSPANSANVILLPDVSNCEPAVSLRPAWRYPCADDWRFDPDVTSP